MPQPPKPDISPEQGAKMLARIEVFFSPENMEKRVEEMMRSFSPAVSNHSLAARESEALAESKREREQLEIRNAQLQDELDRAFDQLGKGTAAP